MAKTIAAIGEALWDVFPDRRLPGGAPCNVAFHAARLGDRGVIVSRVGEDVAGDELLAALRSGGVETGLVQRDRARSTGTVRVTIDGAGPRYEITEGVAWDQLVAEDAARALVRGADALCVGSLAQRCEPSCQAIQRLLADARGRAMIVFDVNLRPPFVDAEVIDTTLRAADVVKMSAEELSHLSELRQTPSLVGWLLEVVGVRAVCVTRGRDGASLTTRQGACSVPGEEVDTSRGDAVGAGDAFLAALVHHLLRDTPPDQTLRAANRYAALVATKQGAMPSLSAADVAAAGFTRR